MTLNNSFFTLRLTGEKSDSNKINHLVQYCSAYIRRNRYSYKHTTIFYSTRFFCYFSADVPDTEYTYTDLCFRDDPKIDVCIRKRINDVVEQFHKGG